MVGYDTASRWLKITKIKKPRLDIGDFVGLSTPDGPSKGKIISMTKVRDALYELEFEIIPD